MHLYADGATGKEKFSTLEEPFDAVKKLIMGTKLRTTAPCAKHVGMASSLIRSLSVSLSLLPCIVAPVCAARPLDRLALHPTTGRFSRLFGLAVIRR